MDAGLCTHFSTLKLSNYLTLFRSAAFYGSDTLTADRGQVKFFSDWASCVPSIVWIWWGNLIKNVSIEYRVSWTRSQPAEEALSLTWFGSLVVHAHNSSSVAHTRLRSEDMLRWSAWYGKTICNLHLVDWPKLDGLEFRIGFARCSNEMSG